MNVTCMRFVTFHGAPDVVAGRLIEQTVDLAAHEPRVANGRLDHGAVGRDLSVSDAGDHAQQNGELPDELTSHVLLCVVVDSLI